MSAKIHRNEDIYREIIEALKGEGLEQTPKLRVDGESGDVWVEKKRIELQPKECDLLLFLHRNVGRVCSKDEIAEAVWPEYKGAVYDYNIEKLISRLRHKIEPDPAHPQFIITVRGRGYRLSSKAGGAL